MLCTLADKLWGSSTSTLDTSCDYASPSKSTEPSDSEASPAKELVAIKSSSSSSSSECNKSIEDQLCSVWMVDGSDAVEIMDQAIIVYSNNEFTIKGRQVKQVDGKKVTIEEADGGGIEKKFKYKQVMQFRQCNEDIYQWLMSNENNNAIASEYGLLFSNINYGSIFSMNVYKGLINSCNSASSSSRDDKTKKTDTGMLFDIDCEFKEYDRTDTKWIDICNDCVLYVYERKKDSEAYMVMVRKDTASDNTKDVFSSTDNNINDNNNILCVLTLSHEDYIYPQPSEDKLTWWGPDVASAYGHRKMFTAHFDNKNKKNKKDQREDLYGKNVENLYAYITNIMSKNPALCEGAMEGGGEDALVEYKASDFCMDIDTEDTIELIDDSSNEEAASDNEQDSSSSKTRRNVNCSSRDTTRDKIIQNPNAKLHQLMYVGQARTFVVRGSHSQAHALKNGSDLEMSVLKFNDEGKEEIVATVDGNKLKYGNEFIKPIRGLLNDNESKLLLVDQSNRNNVYNMDIDHEKIITKYNNQSNIHNIVEAYKGASTTPEPTFLGHNSNQLLTIDTRINNHPTSSTLPPPNISYTSNVQFTAAGVDSQGHILMGSKMGDMRLYDGKPNKDGKFKRAKTHLLGLGEPLLNVCVNKDGSWILGTCSKYLVLFPVKLAQTQKTGFVTALGKSKPKPIILKLGMTDMAKYNIGDLYFHKAEFNTNESAIVTSTGNLAIIWNFQKVIENNAKGKDVNENAYTIKSVDDYIKDIGFIKGGEKGDSIVVATPCGITTAPVTKSSSSSSSE